MEIKTKDISFCDKKASNVVNSEAKEYILNNLKTKYDISISDRSAIMMNDNIIRNLERNQHLISIKSSGTNYFLYMTNINNINYCFYIDRKIKQGYSYPRIISIKYRFSDIIFNDTLFEGELVRDIFGKWQFLICDLLCYKGEKHKSNIGIRFNNLYHLLSNNYQKDLEIEICPLSVKRLFYYSEFDYIFKEFIPNLPYDSRGLYFYTLNTKHSNYLHLFSNIKKSTIKKSNTEIEPKLDLSKNKNDTIPIVFGVKITEQPDIYDLYCLKDNVKCKYGIAHVSNLRSSKKLRKLFTNNDNEIINMLCEYSEKFKKWEPKETSTKKISRYENIKCL